MMTRVPILTEVVLRAWGTDDPRLLPMLRAENQPGRHRRAAAIERRAQDAGWPMELGFGNGDAKKALSQTMRRLEGMDFSFQGRHRRRQQQRAAAAAWDAFDIEGGDDAPLLLLPDLEAGDRVLS